MVEELYYNFPCGCKFKQESERVKEYDGLPPISMDYYNIRQDCPKTLQLLASGHTRGVFQLESNLGRSYSKKLEPDNINQIADLIAILRPGSMQAMLDNKSMTVHYIDRKHHREPVVYTEPKLSTFLDDTFGIMIYQEQTISIARFLANFSPEQANALRSAIGKKKMDKLMSLKIEFINGCVANGIDEKIATDIFENIEASGRYSFNKSHSYEYGMITYLTAYMKAHFPIHFFCAALKFVKDDDELRNLLSELPLFDVQLLPPKVDNLCAKFNIVDGAIQYGVGEIRGCGSKTADDLIEYISEAEKKLNKEVTQFTWYEFLTLVAPHINCGNMNNLILCGFLDNGTSRKEQLHQFNIFQELSEGESKWVVHNALNDNNLISLFENLLKSGKVSKKRQNKVSSLLLSLQNPGKSLLDDIDFICKNETQLLGVTVSVSKTQDKEKYANIKCTDFVLGNGDRGLQFVVEVKDVFVRTINTGPNSGKQMANVKFADRSGEMECTIFSKEWTDFRKDVILGNVLLLKGERSRDGTLKVNEIKVL